jgi:hypothetical protein
MQILRQYGGRAKAVLPELRALAEYFDKEERDFPRKLSLQKVQSVRETIAAIEVATEMPELVRVPAK